MISDRILNPTVIAVIGGLHVLLLLGAWQATPPQLALSTDSLSYVDLSGFSQAGAAATQPPAAALAGVSADLPPCFLS